MNTKSLILRCAPAICGCMGLFVAFFDALGQDALIRDISVDVADGTAINLTAPHSEIEVLPKILGPANSGTHESTVAIINAAKAWLMQNPNHDAQDVYFHIYPVKRKAGASPPEAEGLFPSRQLQVGNIKWQFEQIIGKEIDLGITPGAVSYVSKPSGRMYFEVILYYSLLRGANW